MNKKLLVLGDSATDKRHFYYPKNLIHNTLCRY